MKFTCKSSELQKGIGIAEKAISQRTSMPVLENLYLALSGSELTLRGNDLELGIESTIPVESVEKEGQILVKAKMLSNIVAKIPDQVLTLSTTDNGRLVIQAGKVDFEVHCLPTEDYPVFPEIEAGVQLQVSVADLKTLIKYTIFSVSFDETKQFLNGVLVKNEGNFLYFVTTDGYRLSLKRQAIDTPSADFSVIVPFKGINELNKIIQNLPADEALTISISSNQFAVKTATSVLISRVINGQFPDYKQVLPKDSEQRFRVPRRSLLEAAERSSIIASASNNVVRMTFQASDIVINATASGMGDFQEAIDVDRISGSGDTKIAFNVRLVLDAIKNIVSDEVRVEFNNGLSPCMIQPEGDDDFTYVIMPIRTGDFQTEDAPREAASVAA